MRGLVALGAAAVLLAGCTSDPAPPATLPPLTTSPTPSPTPVPTPTGINAPTPDGANAFIRAWFAELNRAFLSRDAAGLRALSATDCQTCKNFADLVDRIRIMQQRAQGGEFSLIFVEVPPIEGATVVADIAYARASGLLVDAQGRTVEVGEPVEQQLAQVRVTREGGRWEFTAMRLVEAG